MKAMGAILSTPLMAPARASGCPLTAGVPLVPAPNALFVGGAGGLVVTGAVVRVGVADGLWRDEAEDVLATGSVCDGRAVLPCPPGLGVLVFVGLGVFVGFGLDFVGVGVGNRVGNAAVLAWPGAAQATGSSTTAAPPTAARNVNRRHSACTGLDTSHQSTWARMVASMQNRAQYLVSTTTLSQVERARRR